MDNQTPLKADSNLQLLSEQEKVTSPKSLKGLLLMDEYRFDLDIPPRGKAKSRPPITLE